MVKEPSDPRERLLVGPRTRSAAAAGATAVALLVAGCTMRAEITYLRAVLVEVSVSQIVGFDDDDSSLPAYRVEFLVDGQQEEIVGFLGGVRPRALFVECAPSTDSNLKGNESRVLVSSVYHLDEGEGEGQLEIWYAYLPLESVVFDLSVIHLSDLCASIEGVSYGALRRFQTNEVRLSLPTAGSPSG